jgi:hypothetical protein
LKTHIQAEFKISINQASDLPIEYHGHLTAAFRTHEPFAVLDIVEQARNRIISGQLEQFIEEKKYGKQAYEELFKTRQQNLLNF